MPENRRKAHFNWIFILVMAVVAFCAMAVVGAGSVKAEGLELSSNNVDSTNTKLEYYTDGKWADATANNVTIPASARLRLTVAYKDVAASTVKENGNQLKVTLPPLFEATSASTNDGGTAAINKENGSDYATVTFTENYLNSNPTLSGTLTVNLGLNWKQYTALESTTTTQTIADKSFTLKLEDKEEAYAKRKNTLELNKVQDSYDTNTGKITYSITVKATDHVPNVTVSDTLGYGANNIQSFNQPDNVPSGTSVEIGTDNKTLTWNIGTMEKDQSKTLTYTATVTDAYKNTDDGKKGAIINNVTAYAQATNTSEKVEKDTAQAAYNPNADVNPYITSVTLQYRVGNSGKWTTITDDTKDIPVNATIRGAISYRAPVKGVRVFGNKLTYQVDNLLTDVATDTGRIKDSSTGKEIGNISLDGNKITMQFDKDYLQDDTSKNVNGTFSFSGVADKNEINEQPTQKLTIGSDSYTLNFQDHALARTGSLTINKSNPGYSFEDGNAYLSYTLSVKSGNDMMKNVVVKDNFSANVQYVDSYVESSINPSEGTTTTITDKNDKSPGTLTWTIGDMTANSEKTLTYKVKLKDGYVGYAQNNKSITNKASLTSEGIDKGSKQTTFSPTATAHVSKNVTSVDNADDSDNVTIHYSVKVTADSKNNWTMKDVILSDNLGGGSGLSASDLNDKVTYENFLVNNVAVNNDKLTKSSTDFKLDLGEMKPNDVYTVTYDVKVNKALYAQKGNDNVLIHNVARALDGSNDSGGTSMSSDSADQNLGKNVWDRKIDGGKTTEAIQQTPSKAYTSGDNNAWSENTSPAEKTVAKDSYQYQVVVNENGDFNVSSATFKDALDDHLAYTGYLKIDYYENGISGSPSFDSDAVAALKEKGDPAKTVYLDIDNKTSFEFKPQDVGLTDKGAYLLTYYAQKSGDLSQISVTQSGNNFTISGDDIVGPGGQTGIKLGAVNVRVVQYIEGGQNFNMEKKGWYYQPGVTGYYNWNGASKQYNKTDSPAAYWVIDVTSNSGSIPANTTFEDIPGGNTTFASDDSLRGVYVGKVPGNEEFTKHYGNVDDLDKASELTKLKKNEDYILSTDRRQTVSV